MEVFVLPANTGDALVSLLKNEEYPSKQEVSKGKQQFLKKHFCGWREAFAEKWTFFFKAEGEMGQQEKILISN